MFYVYAISSIEKNYIYVGLTSNFEERLKRHNGLREKNKTLRTLQTFIPRRSQNKTRSKK